MEVNWFGPWSKLHVLACEAWYVYPSDYWKFLKVRRRLAVKKAFTVKLRRLQGLPQKFRRRCWNPVMLCYTAPQWHTWPRKRKIKRLRITDANMRRDAAMFRRETGLTLKLLKKLVKGGVLPPLGSFDCSKQFASQSEGK